MYQHYFGLAEAPFSIAPDPRYLYLSQRHQEALAHLLYGVSGDGGFVLLTGEVGAGKTTVCRCLLDQIPESCDVAYIFNPRLTVEELLSTICLEFRIACPPGNTSIKVFVDALNEYLLDANARGRHTVLIIDEAQNLSADVLEQMRLLTNLETNQRKLLQIILLGQPELAEMLARPELRQLAQRIVARYHLGPLTKPEVAAYVRHRLDVAGATRPLFPASLASRLYHLSGGVPRVINVLCDRALLGAFVQGKERIDAATLAQAAREVFHPSRTQGARGLRASLVTALLLAACAALALLWYQNQQETNAAAAVAIAKSAANAAQATPQGTKSAAVLPDTLDWPAGNSPSRSQGLAYAALFRAWGLEYQGGDACREAAELGLRCRSARGGLDELRRIDRPGVLLMQDDRGQEFHATLTALQNGSATFVVGAETRTVSLGALATQWSGRYTLFWRMPAHARENIRLGERGAAVAWLSRQLAHAQGRAADPPGAELHFDELLVRQVKQFQLAQGLVPDGAVGPQTLMHLSGVADAAAPKLVQASRTTRTN